MLFYQAGVAIGQAHSSRILFGVYVVASDHSAAGGYLAIQDLITPGTMIAASIIGKTLARLS